MDRLAYLNENGFDIWNLPKLPYIIGKDKAAILSLDLNSLCMNLGFVYAYSDICDLYWYMFRDVMDIPMLCHRYQTVVDRLVDARIEEDEVIAFIENLTDQEFEEFCQIVEQYQKLKNIKGEHQ